MVMWVEQCFWKEFAAELMDQIVAFLLNKLHILYDEYIFERVN